MKRAGHLIERITDWDNLNLAFYKAQCGKQYDRHVLAYRKNLNENLNQLKEKISSGDVKVGEYHYFKIYDPKERIICAASFDERVLHHAIMNVCHDYFERNLIFDTYATRVGKGTYKAIERAFANIGKYKYVAKLDFRKYFDSISHEILKMKLARFFKDRILLKILCKIIDTYNVSDGYGIPIGNLTSQYFANFFLSDMDHYIKEVLRAEFYIRYMDDILLMSNDKDDLKSKLNQIILFSERLHLKLKPIVVRRCNEGVSFLGYKLYSNKILLNKLSCKRFIDKYCNYENKFANNEWNEHDYQTHLMPLLSFTQHAYSKRFRKEILEGSNRVNRGGSWNNNAKNCRVSNRNNNTPDNRNNNLGFRLAAAQNQQSDDMLLNRESSCIS